MDFRMNKLLKKMMVALLSLGLAQAVWADKVPDFKEMLQVAEQGNAKAQFSLGKMMQRRHDGISRQQNKGIL